MRKFFNFRYPSSSPPSAAASSTASSPVPPPPKAAPPGDDKVFWEPPWESGTATPPPPKCYPEEDAPNPRLWRSWSFSSAADGDGKQRGLPDRCTRSPLSDSRRRKNSNSNSESYTRSRRGIPVAVRQSDAVDKLDSPSSPTGYQYSSANSPYSSPIPLRCRSARITNIVNQNKILDLYIDGEHQDIKYRKDAQKYFSDTADGGSLIENRVLPSTGRPPRAQSTAPSSPTYRKGNARTYLLREVKDSQHLNMQELTKDDLLPLSPEKPTRRNCEKLLCVPSQETMMKSHDSDSEILDATEDIYENSSNTQLSFNSNITAQEHSPYGNINGYFSEEPVGFQKPSYFLEHGLKGMKKNSRTLESQENNTDEELHAKHKEVEQILIHLSEEDLELEELEYNSLNELALLQTIKNIAEDRKYLALELASQIKYRITERSFAKERIMQARLELDIRTKRLEKEKNELQSSLEKELDRRSSSWSLKLEKFRSEEQRLRDRVRELAEQNVSLQREISVFKGNEVDNQSRIMDSEMQLNTMTASMKEVQTENTDLHQHVSDLQQHFKVVEEECNCIRISYKQKEKENKELQKVVVRLQRTCSEQDKTINGLRQGFSNEIGKLLVDRGDNLTKLQMEQLRLTGVEQMLRKEIESCRNEMNSLKHENMCLLDRLQVAGNGYGSSSIKLDKELCARVDFLQAQSSSLLNDNVQFCDELVSLMNSNQYKHGQVSKNDFDGYPVAECTMNYKNLRRRVENYKRSLQTVLTIMDEKRSSEASICQASTTESDVSRPSKNQTSEDAVELELKAETLLTTLLREKLCSNELELEQLQSDLASSVRAHDVLQTETQRLRDKFSCLTHTTKDMELQMLKKDEIVNQLQHSLQGCTKELTATRSILTKVSEERDHLWEQVKNSRETIMLLDHEVSSLKKKIEALDEDILVKEGQIDILRDSLGDKPFDFICSPKSVDQFAMDYS